MIHVMAVYGTRPEAIKMAPLVLALQSHPAFTVDVVVTGQHREMLDQVHRTFGIVPCQDLDIHASGQTLTDVTCRTLSGLEPLLSQQRPDVVLVQGDTTTTFAASLAAFYASISVVHAEAGLRTDNPYSPFPEEVNRRMTTQLATLHLAPTAGSRRNLLLAGVKGKDIVVTGNSVIDALLWTISQRTQLRSPTLAARLSAGRPIILVTAHRRESWGEPMRGIGRALGTIARRYTSYDIIFPIHRNRLVRDAILPSIAGLPNVRIEEPLPYDEFCHLMHRASIVLTDSGGIQEEAPSLGRPVLVMRENTERPEAVAAGVARLVGTDPLSVVGAVSELIEDTKAYSRMAEAVNPYGDGEAARRTVAALLHRFADGPAADEFAPGAVNGGLDRHAVGAGSGFVATV